MQLLISDTNVLIDIENGNLTRDFFRIGYEIAVPDLLYEIELKERHAYLLQLGLKCKCLNSKSLEKVEILSNKYRNPSRIDCAALSLALQEECPILTGDKALRNAAKLEGVEVHGTELIRKSLIELTQAKHSFDSMLSKGSRLPQNDIEELLQSLKLVKAT